MQLPRKSDTGQRSVPARWRRVRLMGQEQERSSPTSGSSVELGLSGRGSAGYLRQCVVADCGSVRA